MPRTNVVGTTAPPGSGAQRCAQAGEREHRIDSKRILSDLEQRETPRNSYRAARRDAPVNCPSCGREVQRRARQQRFCSRRCRQKASYGEKVARGDFSTRTIARPTNPPKKDNKFKALQRAKSLSSHSILAPERVLAVELFDRSWKPGISSGGVAVEIGRASCRERV